MNTWLLGFLAILTGEVSDDLISTDASSTRLAFAGVAVFLGLALIAGYTLIQIRSDALAAHSARLKDMVEVSQGIIGNYQKLEADKKLTLEEAQMQAKEALRSPRFGKDDYYFLYDFEGRALMVAGNPKI